MDKNKDRMDRITSAYMNSDIKEIPFHRFPAVVGKNVNINDWLIPEAIQELKQVENKKDSLTVSIVRLFTTSHLSLLFLLISLVAGAVALTLTPREEDPQIIVPVMDVFVSGHRPCPAPARSSSLRGRGRVPGGPSGCVRRLQRKSRCAA